MQVVTTVACVECFTDRSTDVPELLSGVSHLSTDTNTIFAVSDKACSPLSKTTASEHQHTPSTPSTSHKPIGLHGLLRDSFTLWRRSVLPVRYELDCKYCYK
jgi:hypothetical protein